ERVLRRIEPIWWDREVQGGQQLDITELARETGIHRDRVEHALHVLRTGHQALLLGSALERAVALVEPIFQAREATPGGQALSAEPPPGEPGLSSPRAQEALAILRARRQQAGPQGADQPQAGGATDL